MQDSSSPDPLDPGSSPFADPDQVYQAYEAGSQTGPTCVPGQGAGSSGDAASVLIPYKNPNALIAYYLGIASMIPCIGFVAGIAALVLGILGLKARKANPQIHGSVHAWIGIIMGGFFTLVWGAAIVAFFVAMISGH